VSLSRLWQQQGKCAEAYELLAPISDWFTERFDTADLQEAKALLAELEGYNAPVPPSTWSHVLCSGMMSGERDLGSHHRWGGKAVTFDEILEQALEMLRRRGRVSYRALKVQFHLDDDLLEILKEKIVTVHQLGRDQRGTMLVWTGDTATAAVHVSPPKPDLVRAPLTYTPPYLVEKIFTRAIPSFWKRACAPWQRPGSSSARVRLIAWGRPCRPSRSQLPCRQRWRRRRYGDGLLCRARPRHRDPPTRGRTSYCALKRQFALDDAYLANLKWSSLRSK
jgi:hypothetical protein